MKYSLVLHIESLLKPSLLFVTLAFASSLALQRHPVEKLVLGSETSLCHLNCFYVVLFISQLKFTLIYHFYYLCPVKVMYLQKSNRLQPFLI